MQLQMLVAAAEEKSLQKAARRVSRTPQAVSMAIKKLEDEIDVPLVDRSSKRAFRLTGEGELLVDYARRSLALLNEGLAAVEQVGATRRSRLRIGANQSIGESLLPRLTHAFREKNPDVKLKIVIGFSEFILAAFQHGDVDVALVADRPPDKGLKVQPLMTDRLIAILNPRHLLANKKTIQLTALGNEPLVLLTEASELRERVVETFRRFDVPLNLHVETGTLDSIKRMVAQNIGIGIVPSLCVMKEDSTNLIAKTIKEFPEDRCLWIVHALHPSAPCQAFVALLKSAVTSVK